MKNFCLLFLFLGLALNAQFTDGTFILNEDWFGHRAGSINYISSKNEILYNVYTQQNNGGTFGTTSQSGEIFGNKLFVVSKQHSKTGGRLVIAEAETLKKIISIDQIGADGRSFVGVDENTGYIGTSKGIYIFNIKDMIITGLLTGSDTGFFKQIGNMIRSSKFIFTIQQSTGILVIDPVSHTVIKTISGEYNRITQSKDGYIWAGNTSELIKIDPFALEKIKSIHLPQNTKIQGSWGAWNAGSFCASIQENVLYWANDGSFSGGNSITKFDIDTETFHTDFFTLPEINQILYGAGLRIDPRTDTLIMTVTESGYGSHFMKNWVYFVTNTGMLVKTLQFKDDYWFPAMPIFPTYSPKISDTFPEELKIEKKTVIDLNKEVEMGYSAQKQVSELENPGVIKMSLDEQDNLSIIPLKEGKAIIKVDFTLSGKTTSKELKVFTYSYSDAKNEFLVPAQEAKVYPNPFTEYLILQSDIECPISLYTINGILIKKTNIKKGGNYINTIGLNSGMYLIKTPDKTFKVIKK